MKRKALGKGLGALLPEVELPEISPVEVDIDLIAPNPDQPRFKMDQSRLEELATSIRENGVLQPILVRPSGNSYQLVAGERRLAAAQRAGLLKIPVVVRDIPDDKLLELALIENIQREQLNSIEEAQAYQNLLDTLGITQEELAGRVAKDRATIANALRLLRLPPEIKLLVAEGSLTPGHARALLSSTAGATEMARVANLIIKESWSVRDTERWAQKQPKNAPARKPPDPNIAAATDKLRLLLGTKVEILASRGGDGAGRIHIHFYSAEDLDRIYSILTKKHS
jgi:ParB family chromosome partitioning protein